jgi:hypothetical protein
MGEIEPCEWKPPTWMTLYHMDESNKFDMDENFHMEQYDSSEWD